MPWSPFGPWSPLTPGTPPLPSGPCGPCGPVWPAGPCAPRAPVSPLSPFGPLLPRGPSSTICVPAGIAEIGNFPFLPSGSSCPALREREALIPSTAPAFLANATCTALTAAEPSPVHPSAPTTSAASAIASGKRSFRKRIVLLPSSTPFPQCGERPILAADAVDSYRPEPL